MATVSKTISKAVANSKGRRISATHDYIMAKLNLTGCNRQAFDDALSDLEASGKISVERTPTHTTIMAI